jgi:hypothetical protein
MSKTSIAGTKNPASDLVKSSPQIVFAAGRPNALKVYK